MTKVKQIVEKAHLARKKLGVSVEEWSNLLFVIGMDFLENWYGEQQALSIAKESNFWDIWNNEWIRDDDFLLRMPTIRDYEAHKKELVKEITLLRNVDTNLVWKEK